HLVDVQRGRHADRAPARRAQPGQRRRSCGRRTSLGGRRIIKRKSAAPPRAARQSFEAVCSTIAHWLDGKIVEQRLTYGLVSSGESLEPRLTPPRMREACCLRTSSVNSGTGSKASSDGSATCRSTGSCLRSG